MSDRGDRLATLVADAELDRADSWPGSRRGCVGDGDPGGHLLGVAGQPLRLGHAALDLVCDVVKRGVRRVVAVAGNQDRWRVEDAPTGGRAGQIVVHFGLGLFVRLARATYVNTAHSGEVSGECGSKAELSPTQR